MLVDSTMVRKVLQWRSIHIITRRLGMVRLSSYSHHWRCFSKFHHPTERRGKKKTTQLYHTLVQHGATNYFCNTLRWLQEWMEWISCHFACLNNPPVQHPVTEDRSPVVAQVQVALGARFALAANGAGPELLVFSRCLGTWLAVDCQNWPKTNGGYVLI